MLINFTFRTGRFSSKSFKISDKNIYCLKDLYNLSFKYTKTPPEISLNLIMSYAASLQVVKISEDLNFSIISN